MSIKQEEHPARVLFFYDKASNDSHGLVYAVRDLEEFFLGHKTAD